MGTGEKMPHGGEKACKGKKLAPDLKEVDAGKSLRDAGEPRGSLQGGSTLAGGTRAATLALAKKIRTSRGKRASLKKRLLWESGQGQGIPLGKNDCEDFGRKLKTAF